MDNTKLVRQILEFKDRDDAFRAEFRAKRAELEALVRPITDLNAEFVKFWLAHLGELKTHINVMSPTDSSKFFVIAQPKKEAASVECYLPFTVDYTIETFLLPTK